MPMIQAVNWGTRLDPFATNNFQTISYAFMPGGSQYNLLDSQPGNPVITQQWTAYEQGKFHNAFAVFETFLAVNFIHDAVYNDNETFKIVSIFKGDQNDLGAFGPPQYPGWAGYGEFNKNGTGWDEFGNGGLNAGGLGWQTIIHEVGHGLGLKHPHDNGPGGRPIYEGVTERFGDYGAFNQNQNIYTMMSYNKGWATGPAGTKATTIYGQVATPMAFDIFVLQQKYGANMTFASGANTYTLPDKNALGTYWACIWDTGGVDTLRYNGTKAAVINLNMASLAHATDGGGKLSYAKYVAGGFTIANGVWIEKAMGGNGADHITGNIRANTLYGRGGSDTISGVGGDDTLNGGTGKDTLTGGSGNDIFRFSLRTDSPVGTYSDRITDFDDHSSNDRIDISAIYGGTLAYRGSAGFTKAGQVRINDVAGPDVIVEVNTGGSLAPDFAIRLVATTLGSMTKTDFIL